MFKECRLFIRQLRHNLKTIGAVAPSSSALARAMLRPMSRRPERTIRVLEVGPGTGAFTKYVLQQLRPGDFLDLIELNPCFCRHLADKLCLEKWRRQGIIIRLHQQDIRHFQGKSSYDYILSGLPFTNFDAPTVSEILGIYLEKLTPEGVLSYFEYSLPPQLRLLFLKPSDHNRLLEVISIMRACRQKHQISSMHIWLNLPPAHARHLKRCES